jgi:Peptidase A4 family
MREKKLVAPVGAPRVAYELVPTNVAGAYTTPAPPEDFVPNTASRGQLVSHGMLWRRPDSSAPAVAQKAWKQAFAKPWPSGSRIVPHLVPQPGKSHLRRPQRHGADAAFTGPNWAGSVIFGNWTTATGAWTIPTVSKPGSKAGDDGGWDCASWIGIDGGAGTDDVLQAGVEQGVDSDGKPSISAWYEWFAPEVPGSPDYVWQTNVDNFDLSPGDTIYATVQYAGVLPPAASTTVASFRTAFNGQLHVDYLSADGHVQELFWDGAWHHNDLLALSVGSPVPAAPGSALVGYATEFNEQQHVIYLDADGHVHELVYDSRWKHNDLFLNCTGNPVPAATGSALDAYVTTYNNQQHVNYLDAKGRVHELFYDNGWHHNDLFSQCTAPPTPAVPGSALDGYETAEHEQQHVNYLDAQGHVHELVFKDGHWQGGDLFVGCKGNPMPAAPGSALDGYETFFGGSNFQQHVNYLDANGHVHELVYKDGWEHIDLTLASGAQPARPGSPLDGYMTSWNSQQHVNYLDAAGHVREIFYTDGGSWAPTDVTMAAPWQTLVAAGSPLVGWASSDEQQHLHYVGSNGHVHELYYVDGGGWIHNDLSAMATMTGILYFGNERTRQHFSITLTPPPGASFDGSSSEWIVEAPSVGGSLAALPRFTSVTFTTAVCCGNGVVKDPSQGDSTDIVTAGVTMTSTTLGVDTATIDYIGP